ncbi:hypothetical protein EON83_02515 [bacterium]|nr:MAG: hypothetical protein EON83_02515 [bacterium]
MHRSAFLVAFSLLVSSASAFAQTPVTIVVDNFESGVENWTHNDKNRVGLSNIIPDAPGAFGKSKGCALLTFKAGKAAWASLSRPVDGAAWSDAGAQTLNFAMNGGGEITGVLLQLRGKINGEDVAFTLPRPVRLDQQKWRQVAVPLTDFKGPKGEALAPRLSSVYMLQFQQSGSWESRFFSIDDITIKGTGTPLVAPTPTPAPRVPTPTPSASTTPPPANGDITVQVDFLKTSGQIRAGANVSLGAPFDARTQVVLESNPTFRGAIGTLTPRWIRLDAGALVDIADSSKPSFNFSRLVASAARAKALKTQVLISLPNSAEWGLDERGYASLCAQAARALRAQNVRAWELATSSSDLNDATALSFYNAGYASLKGVSPTYLVGGTAAAAGEANTVGALLRGARGLDFLAVRFFGTPDGGGSDAEVMNAARTVTGLKTAAGLLDKSRFRKAALFITEANIAGVGVGGTTPDDPRLTQMIAGAWWGQFLSSGSRLADQIFTSDASNPEWGLLDAGSKAYPAYYASWMWNTFFPSGAARVITTSSNEAVTALAANTATAHNVWLINTTNDPQNVQLGIRGFAVLRQARIRIFDDPRQSVRFEELPKSPFQTIKLAPYAVAVLQFIEPPKK